MTTQTKQALDDYLYGIGHGLIEVVPPEQHDPPYQWRMDSDQRATALELELEQTEREKAA